MTQLSSELAQQRFWLCWGAGAGWEETKEGKKSFQEGLGWILPPLPARQVSGHSEAELNPFEGVDEGMGHLQAWRQKEVEVGLFYSGGKCFLVVTLAVGSNDGCSGQFHSSPELVFWVHGCCSEVALLHL